MLRHLLNFISRVVLSIAACSCVADTLQRDRAKACNVVAVGEPRVGVDCTAGPPNCCTLDDVASCAAAARTACIDGDVKALSLLSCWRISSGSLAIFAAIRSAAV